MPYAAIGALLLAVAVLAWLAFGRGPRRRRAYRKAQALLHHDDWLTALTLVQREQTRGRLSAAWEGRFRHLEGECHRRAGAASLLTHNYEAALSQLRTAARLLYSNEADCSARVLDALLAEVRRLCAAADGGNADAALQLTGRAFQIASPCAEASFWQGLCQVRLGRPDLALAALQTAQEAAPPDRRCVDPPLYLGALLLREGRPQEALRHLAEANRLVPGCPFVTWQLGLALVAANGDAQLAVRALQRSLGPQGLTQWNYRPQQAWVEGLPEGRSYVRRLAAEHPFVCPVLGGSIVLMVRQGQLALGQALYRLGHFQESADVFAALLGDSPPTAAMSRGLGIALARLERYEDAFKHLRAAFDMEEPKRPLTAGYLALCGARGKPTQVEHKQRNVVWAIRLLAGFDLPGSAEWAGLCSGVFAEARDLSLPLAVEDQVRLCDTLAAAGATDPAAAAAYAHLTATAPDAVRSEHAWLYCRAAQQHGYGGPQDLDLFARAFADGTSFRAFCAQRQWDIEEIEFTYLERFASQQPGRYPEVLGPEYPFRAEQLLLDRARRLEETGRGDAALACAAVLVRLAPRSLRALDRLAQLSYRRGDLDRAAELLAECHELAPASPWPLVRRAVVEQQRGNGAARTTAIDLALARTTGAARAAVAFLGARLAAASDREQAGRWLQECLKVEPDHTGALWVLAALRSVSGDRQGLAALAPALQRPDVSDARFHYLAAVGHLAVGEPAQVHEASRRAAADPALAADCAYLDGWAHWQRQDPAAAAEALEQTAQALHSPSVAHARALLGKIHFSAGRYQEAVRCWSALDGPHRAAWNLDPALRETVFLTGLQALQGERFEEAAERFHEAKRLGCRDRRLGALLTLSLVRAGQDLLAEGPADADAVIPLESGADGVLTAVDPQPTGRAVRLLDQAVKSGHADASVAYLLARAHQQQGDVRAARTALERIARPDAHVSLQRGLLALRDKQFAVAEQEFARALELDAGLYEAGYNLLLTRLSLGQIDAAALLIPQVANQAPFADDRAYFENLLALLRTCQTTNGAAHADAALAGMILDEERRLLDLLRSLGHLETASQLLRALAAARPDSPPVQEVHAEVVLARVKTLLDRCDWAGAQRELNSVEEGKLIARPLLTAYLNVHGCCACLLQDAEVGAHYLRTAVRKVGSDARLQQNLALALEWQGQLELAEPHWNLYFNLLDRHRIPAAPGIGDYVDRLAYEGLSRLATMFGERERWTSAVDYAQRAQRMRPEDPAALERLFTLYNQAGQADDARRVLRRLQQLRPGDLQFHLFELDLIKVKNLDDVEQLLGATESLRQRYPSDGRVADKVLAVVATVVTHMGRLCDHLSEQLARVTHQVQDLPAHQINWPYVREVMRDLRSEFQRLRRITGRCLPLATDDEPSRLVRELAEHLDRKIERCRELEK
jgi:tetratricopeptide (TPR) repeat protein